jgi:hypothetical protein
MDGTKRRRREGAYNYIKRGEGLDPKIDGRHDRITEEKN